MAETDKDDLISIIDDDDREAEIPGILPLMPVRDIVVFTDMVLPLFVGREKSVRAVQEAVACGCIPLAPDRLAYPEFVPAEFRYPSFPGDPASESDAIATRLLALYARHQRGELPDPPVVSGLSWTHLRPAYAAELKTLGTSAGGAGQQYGST